MQPKNTESFAFINSEEERKKYFHIGVMAKNFQVLHILEESPITAF